MKNYTFNPDNKAVQEKENQTANLPEEEGVHQHGPQSSPNVQGEGEASGSAPDVTSDDDVLKTVEETLGQEPKPGETIADIINKSEEERQKE